MTYTSDLSAVGSNATPNDAIHDLTQSDLSNNDLSNNELSNNDLSNNDLSNNELSNNELSNNDAINYVEIIETVISSLDNDQSAMVSHTDSGHVWKFKYGSVEVFVQLTGNTSEDMFVVWSPVLKLPTKHQSDLLDKLMQLNWFSTYEARFAITDNLVVVCSRRTLSELSPGEVSRNITIVATIADDYDEPLQQEFGQ